MKLLLKKLFGNKLYLKAATSYSCFHAFLRHLSEYIGCFKYSKVALNDLDNKLAPFLDFKNGFFIEAGANNGITQSNTYFLEKALGWQGILIEPIPRLYIQCKANRPNSFVYNFALVGPQNENTPIIICDAGPDGLMSKVANHIAPSEGTEITICGKTLTAILSMMPLRHIDFFSLDVEGYELEALKGLDLSIFKPTYILVETGQVANVDQLLFAHYDRISQLTIHDYLYKLRQ